MICQWPSLHDWLIFKMLTRKRGMKITIIAHVLHHELAHVELCLREAKFNLPFTPFFIIIHIIYIIININIIITTRPRPAFGQLGLGRSSGGKTSGDVSTPHFAPSALSSALKQYILALHSRSSSSLQSSSSLWSAESVESVMVL